MSTDLAVMNYSKEDIEIIKDQIAKNCSDRELGLFIKVCQQSKLDPFTRQIYAIQRKQWNSDKNAYEYKMSIQTSIDGFRVIAQRTGEYEGQVGPFWCGGDGVWKDVWLSNDFPRASKVGTLRKGFKEPVWGVARFDSYVQIGKDKKPSSMWGKMPDVMIAKCAEALSLRKAFPNELSGLYTSDEMKTEELDIPSTVIDNEPKKPIPPITNPANSPVKPKLVPSINKPSFQSEWALIHQLRNKLKMSLQDLTVFMKENINKELAQYNAEDFNLIAGLLSAKIEKPVADSVSDTDSFDNFNGGIIK